MYNLEGMTAGAMIDACQACGMCSFCRKEYKIACNKLSYIMDDITSDEDDDFDEGSDSPRAWNCAQIDLAGEMMDDVISEMLSESNDIVDMFRYYSYIKCDSCEEFNELRRAFSMIDGCTDIVIMLDAFVFDARELISVHGLPSKYFVSQSYEAGDAYDRSSVNVKDILASLYKEYPLSVKPISSTKKKAKEALAIARVTKPKKTTTESNMSKLKQVTEANKAALKIAAEITAGKVINNKAVAMIKPKLPMMVRGLADSEIFNIVIANAVSFAISQYMPDNKKANILADCMMKAGACQMMESFNIEGMLDDLLDGVSLPGMDKEKKPKKVKETKAK